MRELGREGLENRNGNVARPPCLPSSDQLQLDLHRDNNVVCVLYRTQREIDGKGEREKRGRASVPLSELGEANVESRKMQYTCVICLQTHALDRV